MRTTHSRCFAEDFIWLRVVFSSTSLEHEDGQVSGTAYGHKFGILHDLINRHCDQLLSFDVMIQNLGGEDFEEYF